MKFPLPLGRGVLATQPLQTITNRSRAVLFSLYVFVLRELKLFPETILRPSYCHPMFIPLLRRTSHYDFAFYRQEGLSCLLPSPLLSLSPACPSLFGSPTSEHMTASLWTTPSPLKLPRVRSPQSSPFMCAKILGSTLCLDKITRSVALLPRVRFLSSSRLLCSHERTLSCSSFYMHIISYS